RIAASHASLWNMPGPPAYSLEDMRAHSARLDEECARIGRDPAEISRLALVGFSFDDPAGALATARGLIEIGFTHLVFPLGAPYRDGAVQWIADELIAPLSQ